MIQGKFNETIALLRQHEKTFPFLGDLFLICASSVFVFSFFRKPTAGNSKENILDSYELQYKYNHKGQAYKYRIVLDRLRQTRHLHICVSIFLTQIGTYTIFSNFDRSELIGVLFSPDA